MEFSETRSFTKRVCELLSDEEYRQVQNLLIERPDLGTVIRRSGGLRKLRVPRSGTGKSGGARVIYYWFVQDHEIFFLEVYAKSDTDDLTPQQLKELRELVRALDEAVRVRRK